MQLRRIGTYAYFHPTDIMRLYRMGFLLNVNLSHLQSINYQLQITSYQLLKFCSTLSAVAHPDSGFLRARGIFYVAL